jgi:hypothetical protein
MVLIGIVSFVIGIFSLLISIYLHALSKENIKGLCYYEIWKNHQESYFVIFNRSALHITRNDVFKDIFIDLGDKEAKLYSYIVRVPFAKSKVDFLRKGNQIHLDIDYIYPRRFALVIIKSNSKSYFTLEGILNGGIITKYKYKIMHFWYHPLTRFAVYTFCCLIVFLTIIFSTVLEDIKTTSFVQIASYILSVVLGIVISENYVSIKGIDLNTYKTINRIVRKREQKERINRINIHKKYLLRNIKQLKRDLLEKTKSLMKIIKLRVG